MGGEEQVFTLTLQSDLTGYTRGIEAAKSMLEAFHTSAEAILTAVETETTTVKTKVMTGVQTALAAANAMLMGIQSAITIMGIQLEPMHELILEIIATSVAVSYTLSQMWDANPVTVAIGVAIAIATATAGITAAVTTYTSRIQAQALNNYSLLLMMQAGEQLGAGMSLIRGMCMSKAEITII